MANPKEAVTHPFVAVYREMLLNYNEVYVRTEVEALRRYRGFFVGSHRVREVDLPEDRTVTLREHYRAIDRVLDPLVTRIGKRMEAFGPLSVVGRVLTRGSIVGRASEYAFQVHGVSPALVRELRARRPVVLHAFTGVSGAHALPLARKLGIPLVVTFGGYEVTATDDDIRQGRTRGRVYLRRREAMKRQVQLIITVSEFLSRQAVERGWPPGKIVVRHRGIDTERFTPEGAPPLSARAPIVFFAGRLIQVKGTAYLLRAMSEVQAHVPGAELVVAGAGELRRALEREARELGVRVRFLGQVTPEVMRACYAEAQVYCVPSITAETGQQEALSNALLEAMAAGLPVVASASGGIPEAVGQSGLLVPERDAGALATALLAVLSDPALRESIGAAARRRITTHFELSKQSSQLEELYDRARREYAAAGAGSR
jgi:glycosyltransferase involved in cell wall biosynthesis